MGYATYIYQFPIGLIATALSFAILPTLSRQSDDRNFKTTLVQGIKSGVDVDHPCRRGLVRPRPPHRHIALRAWRVHLCRHVADRAHTSTFLLGLSFAAVDTMLIFAFYARKDTLTPSLVGVVSVIIYLVVALALIQPSGFLV